MSWAPSRRPRHEPEGLAHGVAQWCLRIRLMFLTLVFHVSRYQYILGIVTFDKESKASHDPSAWRNETDISKSRRCILTLCAKSCKIMIQYWNYFDSYPCRYPWAFRRPRPLQDISLKYYAVSTCQCFILERRIVHGKSERQLHFYLSTWTLSKITSHL